MMTGMPGRLGITITGPLSARAGAGDKAANPAIPTKAITRRSISHTRLNPVLTAF